MAVYFIQGIDGGPIKIGYAENPEKRLERIQSMCPYRLRIIRVIDGDQGVERGIHNHFLSLRSHGEWFNSAPELLEYIKNPYPLKCKKTKKKEEEKRRIRFALRELMAKREAQTGKRCTYEEIGEATGLTLSTISLIANNKIERIPVKGLRSLLNFFECEPNDFIVHTRKINS